MKKPKVTFSAVGKITFAGLIAITTLAIPSIVKAADDSLTDTIEITIASNCELSYGSTAHSDSDGTWDTTTHTLSATRANSSATSSLGSTSFSVTCNDGGGSQVTLTATSLTNENSDTIEFDDAEPSSSVSSWGITDGTSWLADGDDVWSNEGSVSGSTFSVTYGVGIDSTQSAGTYTGTATYTLTHPYGESSGGDTQDDSKEKIMQNVATWGSTLETGDSVEATDSRDNKTYIVTKLADGNIWMTQNLDFDIDSSKTYTSADTDISGTWAPSASTYATSVTTWSSSATIPESYDPGDLCWKGNLNTNWDGTLATEATTCTSDNMNYHIGNYYNWTAAVAMNDSSSYTAKETTVTQSICPAGWTLPLSGDETGSGSFYNLLNQYGLASSTTNGSNSIWGAPLSFVLGGGWNGSSGSVASDGRYWSSVVDGSDLAYNLDFDSDGYMNPQFGGLRGGGFSVRCVAIQ